MAIVFDTSALLRRRFTAADFTPTEWDSAEAKADFANKLCQFIASDFKDSLFTKVLYNRLHLTFGHIACYNREGFFSTFFRDLGGKVEFLEQTLQWPTYGDAGSSYCDVERAVQRRLQRCNLLSAYRALRTGETERREREALHRLKTKYEGTSGSPPPAVMIVHAASRKPRPQNGKDDQATLF